MNKQVVIGVSDNQTADTLQRELVSKRIRINRFNHNQALRFGMKLGPAEASPKEFIEIVEAAPELVDDLFDALERFRNRFRLFIDEQPAELFSRQTLKTSLREPETFKRLFGRS